MIPDGYQLLKLGKYKDGREGFAAVYKGASVTGDYYVAVAYVRDPSAPFGIEEICQRGHVDPDSDRCREVLDLIDGDLVTARYRCPAKIAFDLGWWGSLKRGDNDEAAQSD